MFQTRIIEAAAWWLADQEHIRDARNHPGRVYDYLGLARKLAGSVERAAAAGDANHVYRVDVAIEPPTVDHSRMMSVVHVYPDHAAGYVAGLATPAWVFPPKK